jgi:acetyl-CoA carboxylase carboxyl transferase subunit alpha
MASRVKKYLSKTLEQLTKIPVDELIALRYEKFRRMGSYLEQLEDGSLEERGSIVGS